VAVIWAIYGAGAWRLVAQYLSILMPSVRFGINIAAFEMPRL